MALYYPPLNWLATDKIWRNLIRRAHEAKVECNDNELIKFAYQLSEEQRTKPGSTGPSWNGRQIRNAFQSALALARNESVAAQKPQIELETRHFQTVAEVSNEFNRYILRVKSGRSDADIMQETGSRADDYTHPAYAQSAVPSNPATYYPPPSGQVQMPMRQATPGVNPFAGFATPQSNMHLQQPQQQQPMYAAANGSPYHSNQQPFYSGLQQQQQQQPPPPFSLAQGYGQQPQQPQQPQQRSSFGQPFQGIPSTQQYQTPLGQQQQQGLQGPPQQPAPYAPTTGPAGVQPGYDTAPGAETTSGEPQAPPSVDQRA